MTAIYTLTGLLACIHFLFVVAGCTTSEEGAKAAADRRPAYVAPSVAVIAEALAAGGDAANGS